MRALIVGLGSIGSRHLKNLQALRPDAEVVVLRSRPGTQTDGVRTIHRIEDVDEHLPDLAIIANPAPMHVPVARYLAERRVHLLVEKPLAASLDGVDELLEVARRNRVVLMVGYHLRFLPSLAAARDAVRTGRIGKLLYVRAEVGQYLPDWRAGDYRNGVTARADLGGGAILELSHEIDYVRWIAGEPARVHAVASRVSDLEIDVEDVAEITLTFASGAVGSVHVDLLQRTPVRMCRLAGSEGTVIWNGIARETTLELPGGHVEVIHREDSDRNAPYVAELQHFLDCIERSSEPAITGEDGRRVLEIALAARQSAREGVALPL